MAPDALRRLLAARPSPPRLLSLLLLATTCALVFVRCTASGPAGQPPEIQVLLERDVRDARVGLDGAYSVEDGDGAAIAGGKRLQGGLIRSGGGGLELNGVDLEVRELTIRPSAGDLIQYGGRSYPGELRVRDGGGRLEVTNVVGIEDYLAGVLFAEMPASFPDEALKAQVVAARTYALWRLDHGDPLLRATTADQVYGGAGPKPERARALVAATRGVILDVGGETLAARFMSTCGGATVDGPRVFADSQDEGLAGVKCEWCKASPKYRWARTLARPDLDRRLGLPPGSIQSIEARRDPLGHCLAFDVRGKSGSRTFDGLEFRQLWNAKAGDAEKLPSCWFLASELTPQALVVQGAGFGHGVGLCQFGAAGLANAGHDWHEIVQYYYCGARLVKRW